MADKMTIDGQDISGLTITSSIQASALTVPCGAPAPLVANGAAYVGCSLPKDHEGQHQVTIKWGR